MYHSKFISCFLAVIIIFANTYAVGLASEGTELVPWSKVNGNYVNSQGDVIKGAKKKGIDVSEWQKEIDWRKVKMTDVDFAIIRCGYGSDKVENDDKFFKKNADMCTRLDIPFGVYLYSYATNVSEAENEARHVLRLIKDYKLSLPVYYDMEDKAQMSLDSKLLGDIAETFCNEIKNAGYEVGIYSYYYGLTKYLQDLRFLNPTWHKWIAQYNSTCSYTGKYDMWQCADNGRVEGIDGNTDINFLFTDFKDDRIMPSDWAKPYVDIAIAYDLLPKEKRNNYENKITRLEFCQLAYNLLKEKNLIKNKSIKNSFKDTDSKEVAALYANNIIKGRSETQFAPEDNITRQELSVVLGNICTLAGIKVDTELKHQYNDSDLIADWARDNVQKMYVLDIMRGDNYGKFNPVDNTTKQEAVITIVNAFIVMPLSEE